MRPLARSFTPPPEAPVVIGYVVLMRGSGSRLWLTCAEVMDQEAAEHDADAWRKSTAGPGGRFEVCAVMGGRT